MILRGKRIGIFCLLTFPSVAQAAEHAALDVPVWTVLPFVGLLLAIALLPIFAGHFWHANAKKAVVAAIFAVPAAAYLVLLENGPAALGHTLQEYISFVVLLGSLYVVAGGKLVERNVPATALTNTILLALGAVLANVIGTTGASMILIRPYLRLNHGRKHGAHVPVFFIFTVSNLGGLLTPLGDPPLFLGFLRGVDFFWTFRIWREWLLANGLVLVVFYFWDARSWRRERNRPSAAGDRLSADSRQPTADSRQPGRSPKAEGRNGNQEPVIRIRLTGSRNLLFLAGIIAAILLQSRTVSAPLTKLLGRFFPCPDLQLVWPWGEMVMVLMGVLSMITTPHSLRRANSFGWGPLAEVAILFAGIFVTMVPATELLRRHGHELGLTQPFQYFWLTGILSAFLDNAPTYVVFATISSGDRPIGQLMTQAPALLQAISCGAVFLGAMTYVGNGPNFMVKAIAEESGCSIPSFFGYLLYSAIILVPIFLLISLIFFL
jgi:Na+/H+ antiporter NhaD/arsenite permease-like protein